jgi:hypothetical protein
MAEIFAPRCTPGQLKEQSKRIRAAAETLAHSGESVRCVCSLLVPSEETALHFFEAESLERVEQVLRMAGLDAEQISLVVQAPNMPRVSAVPNELWGSQRSDAAE